MPNDLCSNERIIIYYCIAAMHDKVNTMSLQWKSVLFLGAITLAIGILVLRFSFTTAEFQYGDNCGYLTLGMAFAQGQGFSDISVPGHPHFLWWPPGFPLAIALFYSLFGPHWVALKLVIFALLYVSFFLFTAMLLRKGYGARDSAAVLVVVSLSSAIHLLSSYLYSETFFTALTLGFFWLADRWSGLRRREIIVLSLMTIYICAIRNLGIALPLAFAAYLVMNRQTRLWVLLPAGLLACYAAVVLTVPELQVGSFLSFFGIHSAPGYSAGSTATGGTLASFTHRLDAWLHLLPHSLRGYGITLIPQALIQSAYALHSMTKLKAILMGGVTVAVFLGWLQSWKRLPLMNLYVVFYMAILFAYGPLYVRLLTPLAPMLILYLFTGLKTMAMFAAGMIDGKAILPQGPSSDHRPRIGRRPILTARTALITVLAIAWALVAVDNAWWTFTTPRRYMPPQFGDDAYQRCLSWVKGHARPDDVVVCDIHSWLFLRRGGNNIPYHFTDVESNLLTFLDFFTARFMVLPPFHDPDFWYLDTMRALARRNPDHFRLVFGGWIDSSCVVEYRP